MYIKICKIAECTFRRNVSRDGGKFIKKEHAILETEVQIYNVLLNQILFSILDLHSMDQDPLENDATHLIRAFIRQYLSIRFRYCAKNVERKSNSIRQLYTKLIHFRGE